MLIFLSLKVFNVNENTISIAEDENASRLIHVIFFQRGVSNKSANDT